MYKLLTPLALLLFTGSVLAAPSPVCSGPSEVHSAPDAKFAIGRFDVNKSYDVQDHNLENAFIDWDFNGNGCPTAGIIGDPWSITVKLKAPLAGYVNHCTVTTTLTDNGVSRSCSQTVTIRRGTLCSIWEPCPLPQ